MFKICRKWRGVGKIGGVPLILMYVLIALLAVFFLFPYLFMLAKSFTPDSECFDLPVTFFPKHFSWDGYRQAFSSEMLLYLKNTMIIIVLNMIVVPISASLCAFGFAKMRFPGRNAIFAVMMATVMLPGTVLSIPLYVMYVKLNWINTFYPLWVPNLFGGGAMNIFLLRQFMRGVPKDIENAAKIDGANAFLVYWKIIMPMCVPILMYILIGIFLGTWNDFSGPLIFIREKSKYTLGLGLYYKFTGQDVEANMINIRTAVGFIMTLVPAALYFGFQKQIEQSINLTGAAQKG